MYGIRRTNIDELLVVNRLIYVNRVVNICDVDILHNTRIVDVHIVKIMTAAGVRRRKDFTKA